MTTPFPNCIAAVSPCGCVNAYLSLTEEFVRHFNHDALLKDWARLGLTPMILTDEETQKRNRLYKTCRKAQHGVLRDTWQQRYCKKTKERVKAAEAIITLIKIMQALSG